jgi:hypothetical protein
MGQRGREKVHHEREDLNTTLSCVGHCSADETASSRQGYSLASNVCSAACERPARVLLPKCTCNSQTGLRKVPQARMTLTKQAVKNNPISYIPAQTLKNKQNFGYYNFY